MSIDNEREIKIEIIGAIQEVEEEIGIEMNASQEAEMANFIYQKLKGRFK